ncbi:MAG: 30S ribosomal protein S16 [Candidatus Magasanikbacteria bacterium]|nr:30S ribosomal protein S16 [Candidatus Magasanikbacteria bacterium]
MLTLKLSRVGKKKQPQYRLIVTEKGRDPWGKALETIGHYNPTIKPKVFTVDQARLDHYIKNGVQKTVTVNNLLINFGFTKGEKKQKVHITKKRAARAEKKK